MQNHGLNIPDSLGVELLDDKCSQAAAKVLAAILALIMEYYRRLGGHDVATARAKPFVGGKMFWCCLVVERLAGLLGQFKSNRSPGLSLSYVRSVDSIAIGSNVIDPNGYHVAAAHLGVDGKIEHRQIACSPPNLELGSDCPDVLLPGQRLAPINFPLFQGIRFGTNWAVFEFSARSVYGPATSTQRGIGARSDRTDDTAISMRPQPQPSTQEVLAGIVERVTYHNAENGFCVLRARARGHRDIVTVVGHAATISAGEWITASGEWVNDRTHGQQFKARFLRTSPPTSADGIEKYLVVRHDPGRWAGLLPRNLCAPSVTRCST